MSESLEHPVAIITGAGSGVGRDTAMLLADRGFAVVLVARTAANLEATERLIREEAEAPPGVLRVAADVSKAEQCERIVTETLDRFGRLDALANVAGSAPLQPIPRIADDVLDDCLAVNLKSVVYLTRAAWPTFKQNKTGVIVSVSSMAALDPFRGFNIYAAAKAGVNLFTKATADEGAGFGLRAYAVAPGAIETPMLRENFSTNAIPADKALDPLVVAGVIADLIEHKHEAETGSVITVHSG